MTSCHSSKFNTAPPPPQKMCPYAYADEDPSLPIESFAVINLRGVSTKLNYYCISRTNVQGTYSGRFFSKAKMLLHVVEFFILTRTVPTVETLISIV